MEPSGLSSPVSHQGIDKTSTLPSAGSPGQPLGVQVAQKMPKSETVTSQLKKKFDGLEVGSFFKKLAVPLAKVGMGVGIGGMVLTLPLWALTVTIGKKIDSHFNRDDNKALNIGAAIGSLGFSLLIDASLATLGKHNRLFH